MDNFQLSDICTSNSDLDDTLARHKDDITSIIFHENEDCADGITHLAESITKGRNRLLSEIRIYSDLNKEKNMLSEKLAQFNKNISQIDDILAFVSNTASQCSIDANYIQDNLDNIQFSTQNLRTSVNERINDDIFKIESKLSENSTTIRKLGDAYNIFRTLSYSYLCCICLQNTVDVYASPCGHTFCNACLKSNFCYFCRKKVDKISKIYFNL